MSTRTVTNAQLKAGTSFMVQGKLGFARLTSQIAGEELLQSDARRQNKGWLPVGKPYTTATVNDARVMMMDPNHPTPEEVYAQESFYTSHASQASGYSYTINNKGKNLPWIGVRNEKGQIDQIKPEGELAAGLRVTLVVRIFAVSGRPQKGVSLDGVIVEEPVRYYNPNDAKAILQSHGLVFNPNPDAEKARNAEVANARVAQNPVFENGNGEQPAPQNNAPYGAEADATPFSNTSQPMTTSNPFDNAGLRYDVNGGNVNSGRNY